MRTAQTAVTTVHLGTGIYGNVVGDARFEERWVAGCGDGAEIDSSGSFFLMAPEEPCFIHVVAQDGGLLGVGPEVQILATPGRDQTVTLAAPRRDELRPWSAGQRAGLKVRIALARFMVQMAQGEPWYSENLAELESLDEAMTQCSHGRTASLGGE